MLLFTLFINEKNATKCRVKNTYRDENGICKCKPHYFGDPDVLSIGCWTCRPKCHRNAVCTGPSVCKCNGGYYGDGINYCKPNHFLPKIVSIHPKAVQAYSRDFVTIKTNKNIPINATTYAMFDKIIVKCNHSMTSLHCQVPWLIPINTTVKISFNGFDWSRDHSYLQFFLVQPQDTSKYFSMFILSAVFVAYIISILPYRNPIRKAQALADTSQTISNLPSVIRRFSATSQNED